MIIYLELKSYFPIKESIENLFAFVFSPLFIVEDVEGITGEGREMFGEGRELVGEGESAWLRADFLGVCESIFFTSPADKWVFWHCVTI